MSRNDPQGNILAFGAQGSYRVAVPGALVASQAANSEVFSFCWQNGTFLAHIDSIRMQLQQGVVASAYTQSDLRLFRVTNYTVADSGGTAVAALKKRTNMGGSGVSSIQMTAAAAGLTIGTRTLDAQPMLGFPFALPTVAAGSPFMYMTEWDARDATHPLILAQNEGFVVRTTAALPATGTASILITVDWTEISSYGP